MTPQSNSIEALLAESGWLRGLARSLVFFLDGKEVSRRPLNLLPNQIQILEQH